MQKEQLTKSGVAVSVIFFGLKFWSGFISGSIAVISDALNSFLDVFTYSIINLSVKTQEKAPDKDHPFGHYRAEPLAGLIISLVSVLLGGSIVKDAVVSFFKREPISFSIIPIVVLSIAVVTKIILAFLYQNEGKKTNSPALLAAAIDSRNDILASLTAVTGFVLSPLWDSIAALIIGLWILYSGFKTGMNNIGYLMGKAPNAEFIAQIKEIALTINGVLGVNDIRAHFVGSYLHVEIHIEVDRNLKIQEAHDIGDSVRQRLETIDDIGTVFVHIDVEGDTYRIPQT